MDAAGLRRAAVVGVPEGGPMSLLFRRTHRSRVAALSFTGRCRASSGLPSSLGDRRKPNGIASSNTNSSLGHDRAGKRATTLKRTKRRRSESPASGLCSLACSIVPISCSSLLAIPFGLRLSPREVGSPDEARQRPVFYHRKNMRWVCCRKQEAHGEHPPRRQRPLHDVTQPRPARARTASHSHLQVAPAGRVRRSPSHACPSDITAAGSRQSFEVSCPRRIQSQMRSRCETAPGMYTTSKSPSPTT